MKDFYKYLNRRIDLNSSYEGLLNYPKYVEIETVNACNARCPMCTINDWERNYPVMKDDVFDKISDDIIDVKLYSKKSISLNLIILKNKLSSKFKKYETRYFEIAKSIAKKINIR